MQIELKINQKNKKIKIGNNTGNCLPSIVGNCSVCVRVCGALCRSLTAVCTAEQQNRKLCIMAAGCVCRFSHKSVLKNKTDFVAHTENGNCCVISTLVGDTVALFVSIKATKPGIIAHYKKQPEREDLKEREYTSHMHRLHAHESDMNP